jgi:hypothetical protein
MKKLINIDNPEEIAKLARLLTHSDGQCLLDVLERTNAKVNSLWKTPLEDAELHRLQGAGQTLDEVIGVIKNAKEWFENLQKK